MNIRLLFQTISYLKFTQIVFQVKNRIYKAKYVQKSAPIHDIIHLTCAPIAKKKSLNANHFTFLNLTHRFSDWNFVNNGTLFTYNQNYFDFINEKEINIDEACKWIDKFIEDIPTITWGMDPYPIALRSINWIKFFCKYPKCATSKREDSLWSQLCLLEKKIEYHLLGNHLLEDAFALYIGGCYFQNQELKKKGYNLLIEQLTEQTLSDGGHYEQSPMYHCILLDRLLDCINFSTTKELKRIAEKQLGWLNAICYKDGTWPMFNDSALGIAPTTEEIFNYATNLNLQWKCSSLTESGYRKFTNETFEVILDCGQITARYQPGHSHADTFNYELRIKGEPFIIDTGISTYNKTDRRQYERSTAAHNTVTIENKNSSEVWGGFRVGKRARINIIKDNSNKIIAEHNGYGNKNIHKRDFELNKESFIIKDSISSHANAISYIHLAPEIQILSINENIIYTNKAKIQIKGNKEIIIEKNTISLEYNKFQESKVIKIYFTEELQYKISL